MKKLAVALISSASFATTGFAHPGHTIPEATSSQSAIHYFVEPIHAIPLFAAVAIVITIGFVALKSRTAGE